MLPKYFHCSELITVVWQAPSTPIMGRMAALIKGGRKVRYPAEDIAGRRRIGVSNNCDDVLD